MHGLVFLCQAIANHMLANVASGVSTLPPQQVCMTTSPLNCMDGNILLLWMTYVMLDSDPTAKRSTCQSQASVTRKDNHALIHQRRPTLAPHVAVYNLELLILLLGCTWLQQVAVTAARTA